MCGKKFCQKEYIWWTTERVGKLLPKISMIEYGQGKTKWKRALSQGPRIYFFFFCPSFLGSLRYVNSVQRGKMGWDRIWRTAGKSVIKYHKSGFLKWGFLLKRTFWKQRKMKDIIIRPKQWGQCRKGIKKETKKKCMWGCVLRGTKIAPSTSLGISFFAFYPLGYVNMSFPLWQKGLKKMQMGLEGDFPTFLGRQHGGSKQKKGFWEDIWKCN